MVRARPNTRIDGLVISSILPAKDDESLHEEFNQTPTVYTGSATANLSWLNKQRGTNKYKAYA